MAGIARTLPNPYLLIRPFMRREAVLSMADIHLHRARLFGRPAVGESGSVGRPATAYPWESPEADLAAAEKLINECGYHRRDEELADAKAAILE